MKCAECFGGDRQVLFDNEHTLVALGIEYLMGVKVQQPSQATLSRMRQEDAIERGCVNLRLRSCRLHRSKHACAERLRFVCCGFGLEFLEPCPKATPDSLCGDPVDRPTV